MDNADFLPTDLAECHRLLLAAHKQSVQLEQRVAELNRVLDETSASHQELRASHKATLEELAWYKRWVHGRRGERVADADGQQHLFDLVPTDECELPAEAESSEALANVGRNPCRRRRERGLLM